jgi:hypothetical protein
MKTFPMLPPVKQSASTLAILPHLLCSWRLTVRHLGMLSDDSFWPTFLLIYRLIPSKKWGIPLLSLSTYLRFWSVICFSVTIWLMFFQKEVGICLALVDAINPPNLSAKGNLQG